MNILVDAVFFQLAQSGISRVWRSVLPQWAAMPGVNITILDRGNCPAIPGTTVLQFPSYTDKFNSADSELIELMCRHCGADLFVSTYYTTPLSTPSVAVLYDMIPERFGFELEMRAWQEKQLCIAHAQRHLCISHKTRADLLEFYPELDPAAVEVAHCGVDTGVFHDRHRPWAGPAGDGRPFVLLVGSRDQHKGYKNTRLFFEAIAAMGSFNRTVVCVGGEKEVQPWITELAPPDCTVVRMDLTDVELAAAYAGAEALVYPSLYEGFGLPVVEAMACGCPVITTSLGSLPEVAGGAALSIDGHSVRQMHDALYAVQDPAVAARLRRLGLAQAARFRWDDFTAVLHRAAGDTVAAARSGAFDAFYRHWADLRGLQGEVDTLV